MIATEENTKTSTGGYLNYWNFHAPPRKEQVETLDFISESKSNTVIAHLPAGVGKSAIAATLAKADTGAVVTSRKLLQSQYLKDWPRAALLMGKQNYQCSSARMKAQGSKFSSVEASCKAGSGWCRDGGCPYKCAKDTFVQSDMGVTNYNWLLSSLRGTTEISHTWLLFDEGHDLEGKLIDSAAIDLEDIFCEKYGVKFELFDNDEDAKQWLLTKVQPALQKGLDVVSSKIESGSAGDPMLNIEASKLEELLGSISFYLQMQDTETWVYSTSQDNRRCNIKPLFASGLFSRFIQPLNKRHLITSATLAPAKMIKKWLGLSSYDEISVSSPFPIANRKVYFKPVAYLNRNNLDSELPKVVKAIDMILDEYSGEKGLIHCHSFSLGKKIHQLSRHKNRLLLHDVENNADQILDTHVNSKFPTVLLSPSMTDGIDLKDSLCRFTIFPKTPYPNLGDKWVSRRKDVDSDWCDWQIAKALMQGVGRGVRHTKDYCDTFVLDGVFLRFMDKREDLFPRWFKQSLVMP